MNRIVAIYCCLLLLGFFSCKKDGKRTEIAQIVTEWQGKEILFPDDYQCNILGKDTASNVCFNLFDKEYKILLYVDSVGCSSCRLKLFEWQQLIADADSLFEGKVGFLFFFQPKNKKEMIYLFKRDDFNYPACIDMNKTIERLNHFPKQQQYQCFLLDKDNKVLMIGNPVTNPKIWDLYKAQIAGSKTVQQANRTSVEVDEAALDLGTIRMGKSGSAVFQLKNTGKHPLVISHVSTSCGCTVADWDKQPVEQGKTTEIKVEIKPEETGYFNKTIEVYGNVNESPVKLTISGSVNNN